MHPLKWTPKLNQPYESFPRTEWFMGSPLKPKRLQEFEQETPASSGELLRRSGDYSNTTNWIRQHSMSLSRR